MVGLGNGIMVAVSVVISFGKGLVNSSGGFCYVVFFWKVVIEFGEEF